MYNIEAEQVGNSWVATIPYLGGVRFWASTKEVAEQEAIKAQDALCKSGAYILPSTRLQ